MLSREVVGEVVIADIDKKKLEGEVMDLSHSGGFFHSDVKAAGDNYEGTERSDIIIITAGVRQREGESRRSLLDRNVAVFRSIIPPLVAKSPDTLILVRTPCTPFLYF
jgi:L-lactate dehydrogenase